MLVGERALWRFTTEPDPGIGGRTMFWPRGRILGGTANVNGMFWVHGDPAEFDHWATLGNQGWSYADLLPLFKRIESYAGGDAAVRGRDGPLHITEYSPRDRLTECFLRACAEAGYPENPDTNGGRYAGGGVMQFSTHRGLRWAVREGYLRPAMKRSNLRVLTGTHATRVMFEGTRASGLEYVHDGRLASARAAREVILCAGTIQSPQLLELSGIGDAERLAALGVAVRHHAPAVGENLRDHLQARLMVEVKGLTTLNDILPNPIAKARMGLRWLVLRNGLMSVPGATAHTYVASNPGSARTDIKLQLHHLTSPDERNPTKVVLDERPGFSIGVVQQQPAARGSVHARSTDALAPPEIRANYLSAAEDIAAFVRGLRIARRVSRMPAFAPHYVRELRPGPQAESDAALVDYIRATIFSSAHQVGTCRMGADAQSVVDPQLRVRGVAGLRVADASILPTIPASYTNAASIVVGETAAELILASIFL